MDDTRAQAIWTAALGHLQVELSKHTYETWLRESSGVCLEDGRLTVQVSSEFHRECLTTTLAPRVCNALERVSGESLVLQYVVAGPAERAEEKRDGARAASRHPEPRLNRRWRFETFVVGECNALAVFAARNLLASEDSPNPLFLCGPVGVGKTHLLHAIGHAAVEQRLKVVLTTGPKFTTDFVEAVRRDDVPRFEARFDDIDLLIVDDVDFLIGKKGTADAFYQLVSRLYNDDKLIAVSSEVRPGELAGCAEKLRSRLSMGLVATMDPPDEQTRLAILRRKASDHNWPLAEGTARTLAARPARSVRDLEGALHELVQRGRLDGAAMPEGMARRLLEMTDEARRSGPTAYEVLDAVCAQFTTTTSALTSLSRTRANTRPRHLAAYLLTKDAGVSLAEAGRLLQRNRSTVDGSVKLVAKELESGGKAGPELEAIRRRLSA
jgi:chromosomal replication initiator protein